MDSHFIWPMSFTPVHIEHIWFGFTLLEDNPHKTNSSKFSKKKERSNLQI